MTEPKKHPLADAIAHSASGFASLSAALREAGQSMAEATKNFEENRAKLRDAVVEAIGQGLPETLAAREAGVTRQTVRDWVGKPKRGDIVTAEPYYSEDPSTVTGPYLPRTDFPGAMPPADAAWVGTDGVDLAIMVKASTVQLVR